MPFLKTPAEIEVMAEGGKRLAAVLSALEREVKPGVPTKQLDALAFKRIKESGAEPAFLNYFPAGAKRAFPATLCVSINDVVVHGLPSKEPIREGDVVKLDLGLKYQGFYVDAAVTVLVPPVSDEARQLIGATREALERGIRTAKSGRSLGDVGHVIEETIIKHKFSILRSLTGHGIGRGLHEDPTVLNFGHPGSGERLEVGMVIAIEPMVGAGKYPEGSRVKQRPDDSFATADGSLSAHFEHTVAITRSGPRILTRI